MTDIIKYCKDLRKRKDLLLYLVVSNLKAQHRNTFLGYFWWLLDPLLGIAIYYFLVSVVFKRGGSDYGSYLVVGMVVWRWFDSTVNTSERSIHTQAGLITQIYLPKILFPIGATLSQLINFGFGLVIISLLPDILQDTPRAEPFLASIGHGHAAVFHDGDIISPGVSRR